jgi:hypothetical protein
LDFLSVGAHFNLLAGQFHLLLGLHIQLFIVRSLRHFPDSILIAKNKNLISFYFCFSRLKSSQENVEATGRRKAGCAVPEEGEIVKPGD